METILDETREAWACCRSLRETRRRLMRYTYGRQWDDLVEHPVYGLVTEGKYYELENRVPLTNNLLRSLVKSVTGRFRYGLATCADGESDAFPSYRSILPESIAEPNLLDELDSRMLEEFLISGCAIQHISLEGRPGGSNVWIDNVSPARFFCNRFLDHRGSDLRLAGMIHEMSLAEMRLRFGRSRSKSRIVEQAFNACGGRSGIHSPSVAAPDDNDSFDRPSDPALCRVYEVWTLRVAYGHSRGPRPVWIGHFFTSDGTLLHRLESPFPHGSHPFVIKLYPLTDGEVHPFIEDVIDQQRHINRLISEIDTILAHSAKGTLLFPMDAAMPGIDLVEQTRLWNRPGAVIPVNSQARRMPEEVPAAGANQGASQLLDIEMKMFQQISGVSAALQGQSMGNSTSASLYESQVMNSAIGLLDIFATFHSFRRQRDRKVLDSLPKRQIKQN